MKFNKESLWLWTFVVVLVDLSLGLILLHWVPPLCDPHFGPPPWPRTLLGAYEAWHLPLAFFIPKLQAQFAGLASISQAWASPQAQAVRLTVFGANSILVGICLHMLLARRQQQDAQSPGMQSLLSSRLRQALSGGQPWRGLPGSIKDKKQWLKSLEYLEWYLDKIQPELPAIASARAQALYYWGQAGDEAPPWLAMGRATLLLAETAQEVLDPDGLAFGGACLKRALALDPGAPRIWRALLEWRVLPLSSLLEAPAPVLKSLGSLGEIWALSLDHSVRDAEKLSQWEERWPHAMESLRLRAETLEASGQGPAALRLWQAMAREAPGDRRWRRRADAILRGGGLSQEAPAPSGSRPPLRLGADWLYQAQAPVLKAPRIGRGGKILAACFLLSLLVRPLWLLAQPLFEREDWYGRWICLAVVSPSGTAIPVGALPRDYWAYLPGEACDYNAITALAPAAALFLKEAGAQEIFLDRPYSVTWRRSSWGLSLHTQAYKDDAPPTLNWEPSVPTATPEQSGGIHVTGFALSTRPRSYKADPLTIRSRELGIEMSIPGQSWTLYFVHDDFVPQLSMDPAGPEKADQASIQAAQPGTPLSTWPYLFDAWGHAYPAAKDAPVSGEAGALGKSDWQKYLAALGGADRKMDLPAVYETEQGVYLDLKERGWAKIGPELSALPLFMDREGEHQIAVDMDASAAALLVNWRSAFGFPQNFQRTFYAININCGRGCREPSACIPPELARPQASVGWFDFGVGGLRQN